jgi:transcriptional regulator with XRE-family HTH domain
VKLLGAAVAHSRARRGLSARALSLKAGLSPAYVTKLESGAIAEPSLSAFARLARETEMTPAEVWVCVVTEGAKPCT